MREMTRPEIFPAVQTLAVLVRDGAEGWRSSIRAWRRRSGRAASRLGAPDREHGAWRARSPPSLKRCGLSGMAARVSAMRRMQASAVITASSQPGHARTIETSCSSMAHSSRLSPVQCSSIASKRKDLPPRSPRPASARTSGHAHLPKDQASRFGCGQEPGRGHDRSGRACRGRTAAKRRKRPPGSSARRACRYGPRSRRMRRSPPAAARARTSTGTARRSNVAASICNFPRVRKPSVRGPRRPRRGRHG